MRKEIDKFGTIYYYNDKGEYHREDGPAIEWADGDKEWYKNDKLYREDGPAVEYANGEKHWIKNGKLHREDGPAIEFVDGRKYYCYNGIEYSNIKSDEEWKKFVKLIIFV